MNRRVRRGGIVVLVLVFGLGSGATAPAQPATRQPENRKEASAEPDAAANRQRARIDGRLRALDGALEPLRRNEKISPDRLADVEVFAKAARWALGFGALGSEKDARAADELLGVGLDRARALADGKAPWAEARGCLARGYRSRVDGSVQPYSVVVPEDVNPFGERERVRLDVVLHGRDDGLTEVRFLRAHHGKPIPPDASGKIVLHVYGRGNNAYRWAGETDVFEAIEAVKRNYRIDDERIVLRGFSMGGAGAWHLGLHYPSRWASVEAGAGFTETTKYAKLRNLSDPEAKLLHIYDAVDYALNAFNVPIVGYGGEDDPQRQASVNIEDALKSLGFTFKTEGLLTKGQDIDFLRVVGAKMGHKVDPASAEILRSFNDEHARAGEALTPKRIRFTTYTLKYNRIAWLSIEQLVEHYERAEVDAEIQGGTVLIRKAENVVLFGIERHVGETLKIGDQEFPLEGAVKGLLPNVYYKKTGQEWRVLDYNESRAIEENTARWKHPHVPGPIDDAFTGSFVCVRGTGVPWSQAVQRWADARLKTFGDDWRRWMRAELPIKDDTQVTVDDFDEHSLILFGDPGSNRLMASLLKDLPVGWTKSDVDLGKTYSSADHAPVLIAANPRNPHRYVVVNSGHTFSAKDFTGTNALLYPRLGDYAVFKIDGESASLVTTGFYNEKWKLR